jgi:autotransporter-associated beta strand protein
MKTRTSNKGSRQISPAKGLLPIMATALITGGVDAGFGGRALAAPVEVTYSNTIYTLETSTCFAPGTITSGCNAATDFRSSSWFGNAQLAKDLSEATKDLLGLPNQALGTGLGPNFTWKSGDPATFNSTALPFEGFEWDPVLGRAYSRGGSWNSSTGDGTSTIYWLAKEVAAPRPVPVAGPILAVNNGNAQNTTASLAAKTLLPQFEGGTLVVSTPGAITDAFTLTGSSSNTIDANGVDAEFSGAFTNASGQTGSIQFVNNGSGLSNLELSAQSTYTGSTGIGLSGSEDIAIDLQVPQALPRTTVVEIGSRGALGVFNNTTIAGLKGQGTIDNSGAVLTLGITTGSSLDSSSTLTSSAEIMGDGSLIKDGSYQQILSGALTYTGPTTVQAGTLIINGTSTSSTTVNSGATLGGTGTITGNVTNSGTVSPGNSIGTLTINGNYTQTSAGTLALEVNGTTSDLLQLGNAGVVSDLAGIVRISGIPTPGFIYTGIAGPTSYQGTSTANADVSSIVVASGYAFCREDDACFQILNGKKIPDRTKLQFGWVALSPDGKPLRPAETPKKAIEQGIQKGGGISRVAQGSGTSGNPAKSNQPTLQQTCVANTGDPNACKAATQTPPTQPPNQNVKNVASGFDGGNAAVASVVNSGVTGGSPILTANGAPTGYTSKQAKAAGLPSDFVTVLHTVNSLPTRSALISSLHQVTAEPYASMQSVALEAMEQFRQNSLALSDGDRAIRLFTEAEVCRAEDGSLIPADSSQRPSDCKPRKLSQASRWSLLIDATNTQASLEGTNDLASLDYNIFQSTYGLQYDASKQWSIGAAFGYGQANLYNYEYANSSINSDTYGGSLWGIYRPSNPWKITGLIGYTNFQYDSNRNINFGGLDRNASANWSGNGFTTVLEAEYDWILSANKADRNAIRLKPNTYVAYSLHSQGDITESGAQSLNLAVDSHTADSLVYGIGFTLETPIQLASSTRLIPRLSVGYEHDFNANTNEEHELTASFADVPALGSLDVLGQNRGANDLNVALNVELETSDQFSLYAGVGGSFWSNGNELNYGGGLRWRFGGAPKASIAKAQAQPPAAVEPSPAPTPQPQIIRGLW